VPDQLMEEGSSGSAYEFAITIGVRSDRVPVSIAFPACTA
jgi:hypothetical protein